MYGKTECAPPEAWMLRAVGQTLFSLCPLKSPKYTQENSLQKMGVAGRTAGALVIICNR